MKQIYLLLLLMYLASSKLLAQTNLYWTNATDQKIQTLNIETKEVVDLVSTKEQIAAPKIVCFPEEGEDIYWINNCGLDLNSTSSTGTKTMFEHDIPANAYSFVLDQEKVFWANQRGLYKGNVTT